MFNPHTFDNSGSAGIAFMEIVQHRDEAAWRYSHTPQALFMPLRRSHLSGIASGPVARVTLEHEFGHPDDLEWPVLEAVYRFPLPGDAAVTGVQVRFGETEISAELADRSEAEREYDEARATGRQAILLTRESPDVFSLNVSGIQSGQNVTVLTSYVQLARPEGPRFSLRVPLTPAPRYTSEQGAGGRHDDGQPLAVARDPGHRFSMDLLVIGGGEITSPTHSLSAENDEDGVRLTLSDGDVIPDRDLLISWNPPHRQDQLSLQTLLYHDHDRPDVEYFLTMVTPPARPSSGREHPREVVLLVDRSGSMHGAKWQAADWAVQRFLSNLNPYDSFSVGLFHSDTRWLSKECLPATPGNIDVARKFILANQDSGGTELETALQQALAREPAHGERARHVVIMTDAQVTNSSGILELAREESRKKTRRRISVLCIDAAPNSFLVHELVEIGGGRASFLTSDPEHDDITTALDEILSFWDEPVETDLTLRINRSDVWVMGRPARDDDRSDEEVSRIDLGHIPASQPIWITGRASVSDDPMAFQLERDDAEVVAASDSLVNGDSAIKALFGAKRLMALEYQLESIRPHWSRGDRKDQSHERLRRLLIAESLNYGLACSETAFVAVRQEAGKLVQRGAIVPNALPYGWEEPNVVYSMQTFRDVTDPSLLAAESPSPFGESQSRGFRSGNRRRDLPSPRSVRREQRMGGRITLFSGVPPISEGGDVVLYELDQFREAGRLISLAVMIDGEDDGVFDGELALYAGGDAQPRARVRLRDVLALGGTRPLNVRVLPHFDIRLVLRNVVRGEQAPSLTIELAWV